MKPHAGLLLLLCGGCASLPRDTDRWTERIRESRTLEVGVVRTPRSEGDNTAISSRERELVETLARRLGARVKYREGNLLELMHALELRELPLLAANVRADSPYSSKLGMSRPFAEIDGAKRSIAVAPGQNRLLLRLDEIIALREQQEGGGS